MKSFSSLRTTLALVFIGAALVSACTTTQPADTKVTYDIALTGTNQIPALGDTGSGQFTGTYDKSNKTFTFKITWNLKNDAVLTLAHFHGPAAKTANGGVRVGFITSSTNKSSGTFEDTKTLDATQESELLGGQWYVNLHSNLNPSGALRGQLEQK